MTDRLNRFYSWMRDVWLPASLTTKETTMFAKIKKFLTANPKGKAVEHYTAIFAGAFGLTAIATVEKAAGTHGFQFTWSLGAGVALAAAKAGYDAIRPAVIKLFANAGK